MYDPLLTIAVRHIELVSDGLEAATATLLAIVNAFPVVNACLRSLTTKVGAIDKIVVHEMADAFASLHERIHVFSISVNCIEKNRRGFRQF